MLSWCTQVVFKGARAVSVMNAAKYALQVWKVWGQKVWGRAKKCGLGFNGMDAFLCALTVLLA